MRFYHKHFWLSQRPQNDFQSYASCSGCIVSFWFGECAQHRSFKKRMFLKKVWSMTTMPAHKQQRVIHGHLHASFAPNEGLNFVHITKVKQCLVEQFKLQWCYCYSHASKDQAQHEEVVSCCCAMTVRPTLIVLVVERMLRSRVCSLSFAKCGLWQSGAKCKLFVSVWVDLYVGLSCNKSQSEWSSYMQELQTLMKVDVTHSCRCKPCSLVLSQIDHHRFTDWTKGVTRSKECQQGLPGYYSAVMISLVDVSLSPANPFAVRSTDFKLDIPQKLESAMSRSWVGICQLGAHCLLSWDVLSTSRWAQLRMILFGKPLPDQQKGAWCRRGMVLTSPLESNHESSTLTEPLSERASWSLFCILQHRACQTQRTAALSSQVQALRRSVCFCMTVSVRCYKHVCDMSRWAHHTRVYTPACSSDRWSQAH